jgi:hypothetical protein
LCGTSMDLLNYSASIAYQTFPAPQHSNWRALEELGKEYYAYRQTLMHESSRGITETYNRFNDPDERSTEIVRLRELHDAIDRTVLQAYGLEKLDAKPSFEPEWIDEEGSAPSRYRWAEDVRDKVLAQLFDLNEEQSDEDKRRGNRCDAPKVNPDVDGSAIEEELMNDEVM